MLIKNFCVAEFCISPSSSLREALKIIDLRSFQFVLVTDKENVLLGVVTDGDIRRALLRDASLDSPVSLVMNTSPQVTVEGESRIAMIRRMKEQEIHFLIKVNNDRRVLGIIRFSDLVVSPIRTNPVVIMAGGKGSRLGTLTDNCPKPMLFLGKKPMLEMIIESLTGYGFSNFYLSVNYLKEHIIDYFGNGDKFGVNIQYLHEERPLDTGGSLGLIEPLPKEPLLVMNGDIFTDLDFGELLDNHHTSGVDATLCLREVSSQIPFGVVDLSESGLVTAIREKPRTTYMANAGIYILNPAVLSIVPKGEPYAMTTFMEDIIAKGKKLGSHIVDGLWIDVGRPEDFEQACQLVIDDSKVK
ncbi:MAG: alcohol dehydrogenase [Deltaproteobacteria bacterium]|nr:MAG: alcohol dehydrogenase [Deltaproteobacteria bacterium]